MRGKKQKDADVDLGLAVISAMIHEGKIVPPVPLEVMAAACSVSWQAIQSIEYKGLRKVRAHFYRQKVRKLTDLVNP